jgi:hypothetical protein
VALDIIDKACDLIGKGFNIPTAVACIIFVGVTAYVALSIMDYTDAGRVVLTGVIALVGTLLFKLVFWALARLLSHF